MKKHTVIISISAAVISALLATSCSKQAKYPLNNNALEIEGNVAQLSANVKTDNFSVGDAQANLTFSKDQYLKMIRLIETNRN